MTETTWHYNLVRYPSGDLGIHEIYVDHSPKGDKISWTETPVSAWGDTPEEVIEVLETMKKDVLKHRILDLKTGKLEDSTPPATAEKQMTSTVVDEPKGER